MSARVTVAEVVRETADACSLVLVEDLSYRPGQFLTLRIPDGAGGSLARCYSLSSSPHAGDRPQLTVKRVPGGYASNWICDRVAAGTVLDVLPPGGVFTPDDLDADLLLFAGGSGITPVRSILRSALAAGSGRIVLLYANRDADSVIFAADLRRLETLHPGRLRVLHWLDAAQGPPTPARLGPLVRPFLGYQALVCGPAPFMAAVARTLADLGAPAARTEIFVSLTENPFAVSEPAGPEGTVEVTMDGHTSRHAWPAGRRLLDVLIDAGLNPPYSCREGICGSCACRLVEGKVELVHNEVLEEEDFAENYILACQAVRATEVVRVTYS